MTIGGQSVTHFYENERIFDVRLRFQKWYRDNPEKIGNSIIPTMNDQKVPLREIAVLIGIMKENLLNKMSLKPAIY